MNDSKGFQDADKIRSGNSHVSSRPVSFPFPIPEGILSRSLGVPSRREAAKHLARGIWKRFCKSICVLFSNLSSKIESMEFLDRGSQNRLWPKTDFGPKPSLAKLWRLCLWLVSVCVLFSLFSLFFNACDVTAKLAPDAPPPRRNKEKLATLSPQHLNVFDNTTAHGFDVNSELSTTVPLLNRSAEQWPQ